MLFRIIYKVKDIIWGIGAKWDKLAPTINHAKEFACNYINIEPKREDEDNKITWERYLAHYGEEINTRIRKNKCDDDDNWVSQMLSKSGPSKIDLVLYRGVGNDVFKYMQEEARNKKDCDLYDEGFLFCSLVKGQEYNYRKGNGQKFRIYVPKGSKIVYLGNVNDEQPNYEVVVMRSAKLKIVSIDAVYINCKLI